MAFNKTPAQDTYQTKQVPLMLALDARTADGNKSAYCLNVVFDPIKNDSGDSYLEIQKREGISVYRTIPSPQPDEVILGAYLWDIYADLAVAVTNYGIYTWSLLTSAAPTFISYPSTATTDVGFTEFVFDNNDCQLIIVIGSNFGTLTGGSVWTVVTDPDAPSGPQLRPFPVFLDGYLFLASQNRIHNSNLNDPTAWTAGNYITVEAYPGFADVIFRSGTYIVALCDRSVQFFYDAANPTGTPLAPVQGATKTVSHLGGFAQQQDSYFFVGTGRAGNLEVYQGQGLKISPVPSASISRWLQLLREDFPESRRIRGTVMGLQGSTVYHIYNPDSPISYGYQTNTSTWSRFSAYSNTNAPFLMAQTSRAHITGGSPYQGYNTFLVLANRQSIFYFNPSNYQDESTNFPVEFLSRQIDFGTYRRKFASRLLIHSDQNPSDSNVMVSWSDDDYQTFSTPRAVNLKLPDRVIYQLGNFRHRSFKLTYSDNFPMRWSTIELDYNQGQV